jgi:glutathione S-transferase
MTDDPSERPTLYVIAGSHACRTGMLMLEHKGIDYRRVVLLTGPHGLSVRMRGFPGHRTPIRQVDGGTHRMLAMLDRAGTVPALRYGDRRVQRNSEIARFLDKELPEPALFPADGERRAAVEEAEAWGDEVFQMAARRVVLATAAHGLDALYNRGNRGRLGPLLASSEPVRRFATRGARFSFRANPGNEPKLLEELGGMLDRIDSWIEAGVLNGEQLNAADYVIAPSIALLSYRPELRPQIAARPAGALVDRVVPEDPSDA